MVEVVKLRDEIAFDLRNRELELPGLVVFIGEKLSQEFKMLGRDISFAPAGGERVLKGVTGRSFSRSFRYKQTNRKGAALQVFTLSARLANIFEASSYKAQGRGFRGPVGKYRIMGNTIRAFKAEGSIDRIVGESLESWGKDDGSAFRSGLRSGGGK